MRLSVDEKQALDDLIEAGLPKTWEFIDKSHPVLTLLRAAEDRTLNHDFAIHTELGAGAGTVASDLTREAVHWAMKSAHKSNDLTKDTTCGITERDLRNAHSALRKCVDYSELCDLMTASWLEGVNLERTPLQGRYSFELNDDLIAHEAANWLWMQNRNFEEPPAPHQAIKALETWINDPKSKVPSRAEQVIFAIPSDILIGIQKSMNAYAMRHWQLPNITKLEQFDLQEFREVWPSILTCAVVPKILFNATKIVNAAVPVGTKEQWTSLLATLTGKNLQAVNSMIDFLTYPIHVKNIPNTMAVDAISTPFFAVGRELALSSFLSLGSSAERNLFILLSNKLSKSYDRMKKMKEEEWSKSLAAVFHKTGLHALDQKTMRSDNTDKGDIDLFVYDKERRIALIVQLKWLLVDRIKSNHIKQAKEGIRQAKVAIDWIRVNDLKAASLLGIPLKDIPQIKFLPLVILKEGMLNGFVQDSAVPLVSSEIFDHYVSACPGDLPRLWQNLADKNFLPVHGDNFVLKEVIAPTSKEPFNGVSFKKHQVIQTGVYEPRIT